MAQVLEQKFGVVSDLLGQREDVPTLKIPKVYMPESSGVFLQYGLIRTMPGANQGAFVDGADDKVQTPDANPIIHHHWHTDGAGNDYVFAYTKAHVYRWNEAGKAFIEYFTCSSDCTLWDSVSLDGKIISTNGVDFVQVWDETTPGTLFAALDTVTGLDLDGASSRLATARYCAAFEGALWLGATTEGGQFYPRRARASTVGDLTDFDVNGSGNTRRIDFGEGSDPIKGFGQYTFQRSRIFVVFKENSVYAAWLVESLDVWNTARTEGKVGLLATHSVINDLDGNLYYIADDFTIRKFNAGIISRGKAKTLRAMNVSLTDDIEAAFLKPYNQLWFSIPSTAGSTGLDAIIAVNLEYGVLHQYPFTVRSFGQWSQQTTYTIDGLDVLSATIDGLDAQLPSIDFVEGTIGFPLDLVSDYDGYTYAAHTSETDVGAAVTRNLVISVDLTEKRSLNIYKRISEMWAYFVSRSTTGTLELSVKEDNATAWEVLGTISLQSVNAFGNPHLPFDSRAKHFLFKAEGTILFDFVGMFWTFEFDGER